MNGRAETKCQPDVNLFHAFWTLVTHILLVAVCVCAYL